MRCSLAACAALALASYAASARAQDTLKVPPELPSHSGGCSGPVSEIDIHTFPPNFGEGVRGMRWLQSIVRGAHANTKEGVVLRFLALQVGEECTELRRKESERILRSQPFIADAWVHAVPDGFGGTRLEVVTVDEVSPIVHANFHGLSGLSGVRGGSQNIGGSTVTLVGQWRQGFNYRDAFGAEFAHYQFLGHPYQLMSSYDRAELGENWGIEARHPYFTDLQRGAWRVSAGQRQDYVEFRREGVAMPAVLSHRYFADIGGVVRIGVPGRLSLFGVSLSQESQVSGAGPVIISDSGLVADTSAALVNRYTAHHLARANLLWGLRNVRFFRTTGFDALEGTQDVRTGFQLGMLFGRSLPVIGAKDDDIFVAADLYAGAGNGRVFGAFEATGEGRDNYNANSWDGVLASGRAALYTRIGAWNTFVADAEWSAGWDERVPFQLHLGEGDGGVRGFEGSRLGGGQRAVGRLEDRWRLGRFHTIAAVGLAPFVDAGRMWALDAPYGVNTPYKVGAGIGILLAVPPRSKRTYRVDIAFPVTKDRYARWQITVSSSDFTRVFWKDPSDLRQAREHVVPGSVFNWP